jgi:heme A synthase
MPLERRLAAAGLALVLVVVLAAASLRLEGSDALVRAAHRVAASLEVIVAAWLAWLAWRGRGEGRPNAVAVAVMVALTVALSVLGIAAGRTPSELQAMGNLLGGLALAATFAWLAAAGERRGRENRGLTPFLFSLLALLFLQALVGARLSIHARYEMPALPAHAMLGLVLAVLLAWFGLGRSRKLVFALALATLLAGFTALHCEYSATAALVHAGMAALLIAATAAAVGRAARRAA